MKGGEDIIRQRRLNGVEQYLFVLRTEQTFHGAEDNFFWLRFERHNSGDRCARLGDNEARATGGLVDKLRKHRLGFTDIEFPRQRFTATYRRTLARRPRSEWLHRLDSLWSI